MLGASFFLPLCYCPNLSSLDIVPEFGADFFRYIVASRMLHCGLRLLRSVRIRQDDVDERIGHEDMFTLLSPIVAYRYLRRILFYRGRRRRIDLARYDNTDYTGRVPHRYDIVAFR